MPINNTRSPFAGVDQANVPGAGVWIQPGSYTLRVKEQRFKEGYKGHSYINEFDVLVTSSPDKHPIGSVVSWVVKLEPNTITRNANGDPCPPLPQGSTKHQMGLGNIKGFLSKALAEAEENITESVVGATVDGQNLLAGTVLKCTAMSIPTKGGGLFTKCVWEYLRGGFVEKNRTTAAVLASLFPGRAYEALTAPEQTRVNAAVDEILAKNATP